MTGDTMYMDSHQDATSREYYHHSSAQRVNTDIVLVESLRRQYPSLNLVIVPLGGFNLLAYASAGFATVTPLDGSEDPVYGPAIKWKLYSPPGRRLDDGAGAMVERVIFGKYGCRWKHHEFLLYVASGRDGVMGYPEVTNHYILTRETEEMDGLIREATAWGVELHNQVWVFDQGYWQKSAELWASVQKSDWKDVILDEGMKKAIVADVENFFDGRETYAKLKVPWKRGIIYYGPPGNGKTISIKAMMHSLYDRGKDKAQLVVPTLYVRTLASFGGPEASLRSIFAKARQTAPCYLVFEDLDSMVNDQVRSYFLNEVDGLQSNDGILMVGSTNHVDRLDPGISKRPSRFDRKYYFPDPDVEQRTRYARYWQGKLKDNDDVEFPDAMCGAVAKITDGFSFAYMQEAFVAALLAIARTRHGQAMDTRWAGPEDPLALSADLAAIHVQHEARSMEGDSDLDQLVLWRELKKQVRILREEMEEKQNKEEKKTTTTTTTQETQEQAARVPGSYAGAPEQSRCGPAEAGPPSLWSAFRGVQTDGRTREAQLMEELRGEYKGRY